MITGDVTGAADHAHEAAQDDAAIRLRAVVLLVFSAGLVAYLVNLG